MDYLKIMEKLHNKRPINWPKGSKHTELSKKKMSRTKIQKYTKICSKCQKRRRIDFFNKADGKDSLHSWCKDCWTLKNKKDYWDNRTRELMRNKEWREAHKSLTRNNHLIRNYGITLKESEEIFIKQRSRCPICKIKKPLVKWVVDHDHRTNMVRGILCDECNRGLGQFKDNIKSLISATRYLIKWGKIKA